MEALELNEPREDKLLTISYEEYAAINAVRCSQLNDFKKSPLHCEYFKNVPQERSETLDFGVAVHAALLEPDTFYDRFRVEPVFTGKTKDGRDSHLSGEARDKKKQWYQDLPKDVSVLKEADFEKLKGVLSSVKSEDPSSKKARELLSPTGASEISIVWRDEETGLRCKARTDYINQGYLVDIKTTISARADKFIWSIRDFGYHRQAAWYLDAFNRVTKNKLEEFYWIAIDNKAPYAMAVHKAHLGLIEKGREEITKLLKNYNQCLKEGQWPGYESGEIMFPDSLLMRDIA